jgi:hypothetical protein
MHEIKHFSFESISTARSMHVTLAVSGWLSKADDMAEAWEHLRAYPRQGMTFALRWDASTRDQLIGDDVSSLSLAVLASSIVPVIAVANIANLVKKEPFAKAVKSAEFTGKTLAKFLKKHTLGKAAVSLIGFSLGTSVIMHCLLELTRSSPGLLHNVVLLGGAAPCKPDIWVKCRRAAAGRMINCYSKHDRILSVLYRASQLTTAIGSKALDVPGVENYDVSALIGGHVEYRSKLTEVLNSIHYQP